MCGVFGIVNVDSRKPFDESRFVSALSLLDHRGPDARRHVRFDEQAILGHTRLSIIDLDERSHQPMPLFGRYWIIYNGEIFNYIELRREFEALDREFRTSSDTEVVLHAFDMFGERCVERFNGMWAFAIYDQVDRSLFCSRDRFGEKPFYYAQTSGLFLFASEIKAMVAYQPELIKPEFNAISNFCRTSVGAQQEQSWFAGVKRLQPGTNLTLRRGHVCLRRYWSYPKSETRQRSFGDACDEYRTRFIDAVRLRLRSDVPVGLTLSSGLDSSSIACAMHEIDPKPHHFFTSTFVGQRVSSASPSVYKNDLGLVDESVGAGRLAEELGQPFHRILTDYTDLTGNLSRIVYHLESGNSSPAVLPLMQLFRHARSLVTVVLEGQGADELLGGYVANVMWPAVAELISAGRIVDAARTISSYSRQYAPMYSVLMLLRDWSNRFHSLAAAHQQLTGIDNVFGPLLRAYTRIPDYPQLIDEGLRTPFARTLQRQHSGGLVNLLHYGDAISMAHGLESRMPFMDHRLVEFVWSLPTDYKFRLGVGKYVHRAAMRGLVPDRYLDERVKFGFNSPINDQFRPDAGAASEAVNVLLSQRSLERGLFDPRGLRRIIDVHGSRKKDHGPLLFRLLSTELWFREFVDQPLVHPRAEAMRRSQ